MIHITFTNGTGNPLTRTISAKQMAFLTSALYEIQESNEEYDEPWSLYGDELTDEEFKNLQSTLADIDEAENPDSYALAETGGSNGDDDLADEEFDEASDFGEPGEIDEDQIEDENDADADEHDREQDDHDDDSE